MSLTDAYEQAGVMLRSEQASQRKSRHEIHGRVAGILIVDVVDGAILVDDVVFEDPAPAQW